MPSGKAQICVSDYGKAHLGAKGEDTAVRRHWEALQQTKNQTLCEMSVLSTE